MADSNKTKKALAKSMKALIQEKPFEKISISDICERCFLNRKSFYYHFKDKYDLVNWIFNTEFSEVAYGKTYTDPMVVLNDICEYFYSNKDFYRKALSIQGQNCFSDHFRELILFFITIIFKEYLKVEEVSKFQKDFISDALVMAFQRWILDYPEMKPAAFLEEITLCTKYMADNYNSNPKLEADK